MMSKMYLSTQICVTNIDTKSQHMFKMDKNMFSEKILPPFHLFCGVFFAVYLHAFIFGLDEV